MNLEATSNVEDKNINNATPENNEIVEEDWSSIIQAENHALLPSYGEEIISLGSYPPSYLKVKCLTEKELSPLDIVNSHSTCAHDATGHHIWLASYFFLDALVRPIQNEKMDLIQMRKETFSQKRVLELGCGTGILGLAIIVNARSIKSTFESTEINCNFSPDIASPIKMILTDADPDALELCKLNCEINNLDLNNESICIRPLAWGTECWDTPKTEKDGIKDEKKVLLKGSFDTVIAADVVYELEALPPLMKSVSEALSSNGNFLLSHVPRFASTSVETLIVKIANEVGLRMKEMFKPDDVYNASDEKHKDVLEMMKEKKAVLFLFEKC